MPRAINSIINECEKAKNARFSHDINKFDRFSLAGWIDDWIANLIRANNRSLNTRVLLVGIGKTVQLLRMRSDFRPIDYDVKAIITKAYREAKNRVLILGNKGTLIPGEVLEHSSESLRLPTVISEVLQNICDDEYNNLCIISGRNKDKMKAELEHIKNLYIVAENGYYYGWNELKKPLEFEKLIDVGNWKWKDVARGIIKTYKERTDGSFIADEETRIRWIFRDVEADFARKEANELIAHLRSILENFPLEISHYKDSVEVKPTGLHKGTFFKKLLQIVEAKKGNVDFVLCIGDDNTDECLFKELKKHTEIPNRFCITVGRQLSIADYYFNDQSEVITMLSEIVVSAIEV